MDSAAMYPLSISSPQGKTSSVKSDSSSGSDHTRYAPFSSSIHRVHLPLIFSFFLPTVSIPRYLSLPFFPSLCPPLFPKLSWGRQRSTILRKWQYLYLRPIPFTPLFPSLLLSPFPHSPSSLVASYLREEGTISCDKDTFILDCTSNDQGGEGEETRLSLCSFTSHYQLFWRVNSLLSTQSISTISCPFSRFSRYIQLDSEYWDDCESLGTEFLSRRQRKSVREEGESGSWSPLFYSTTSSSSSSSPMDIPDVLAQTEGGCTVVIDGCSLRYESSLFWHQPSLLIPVKSSTQQRI